MTADAPKRAGHVGKYNIVHGKKHPTKATDNDIIDWDVSRPRRPRGTIVEGVIVGDVKQGHPSHPHDDQ